MTQLTHVGDIKKSGDENLYCVQVADVRFPTYYTSKDLAEVDS
jgi:hypothetical protein